MEAVMAWFILFLSGLLEIVWVSAMKASDGFTNLTPSIITFVAAAVGFWLLGWAMRDLPMGTAYAVWVGIGAVGAFVVGVVWMHEPLSIARVGSVGLIVAGIIGLRLSEGA
jgi:quaternary ammonium compound-resistance protein SugE